MSKISIEQIATIRTNLLKWFADDPVKKASDPGKRTNGLVGKSIGYDGSAVSGFRNGNYTGDNETLAEKIQKFLEGQKQYGSLPKTKPIFVQTTAADEIFMTIDFAKMFNKIGLIIGEQGGGKSISLSEFANRDSNIIYIPIPPKPNIHILTELICKPLKINTEDMGIGQCFYSAVAALNETSRPMIFDEGEHLHVSEHEMIRRLQDFTNIPMVLSGTARLEKTLRGRRGELKQLSSRIGMKTEIPLLTENDTRLIIEANYPEAAEFYETFHLVCKKNGRNLENLFNLIRYAVTKTNCEITEELIYESATRLLTQPA
jgi:DNA transposition AAA+ family ATPase